MDRNLPQPELTGRVALVTGAARGMGAAHARTLAARGARLVLTDLDAAELRETAAQLRAAGAQALEVAGDVTDAAVQDELLEQARQHYGALDIVVHNAGIMHDFARIEETEPVKLERYFQVHVQAPYALTRKALPLLRSSQAARVIFISSSWGQVPDGHSYGYMTSKAAQLALMRTLAKDLMSEGILVNAVTPGAVATRMIPETVYEMELAAVPLGRLADPEEIAASVAFLASDQAAFITGQTLNVNGGAVIVGV